LGLQFIGHVDRDAAYLANRSTLNILSLPTDTGRHIAWDHTLNTVDTAGTIFEVGPNLAPDGNGKLVFGTTDVNGATTQTASSIVYSSGTIPIGAVIRTQHNHSESVGITVVNTALNWGSATCPFPTSGEIYTVYDRQLVSPGLEERITFKSTCGEISYTHPNGTSTDTVLNHVF
jgi:uncharacterized protein with beta-barrel porin domain